MSIDWQVHIRVDRGLTHITSDDAGKFLGSPVDLNTVFSEKHGYKENTFALSVNAAQVAEVQGLDMTGKAADAIVGLCLFTLKEIKSDTPRCHLIGLKVEDCFQWAGKPQTARLLGIGTALLLRAHALAFTCCQEVLMNYKTPIARQCDMVSFMEPATDPGHRFTLRTVDGEGATLRHVLGLIQPGSCRSDKNFLGLLNKFGYEPIGAKNMDGSIAAMETSPVALREPYLDPDHKRCMVKFKDMSEWRRLLSGPPPFDYLLTTTTQMICSRIRITGGGPLTLAKHGLLAFTIPAALCQAVLALLQNPEKRGKDSMGPFLQLGPSEEYRLYTMQDYVGCQSLHRDPSSQQASTFITGKSTIAAKILSGEPAMKELALSLLIGAGLRLDQALVAVGSVFCIHFFEITSAGHATYGWHADCKDLANSSGHSVFDQNTKRRRPFTEMDAVGIRSLVVQLGAGELTAMCMYGHAPTVYQGQGAAVAFNGSCVHTSIPWADDAESCSRRPVWKVSMFWLPDSLGAKVPKIAE